MIRFASACLFLYWTAIFVATHLPSSALPRLQWSDKVYHAIAFSGLAFLLAWAIPARRGKRIQHLLLAALFAIGYACLDEFSQKFIPGRSCDVWDVAADVVGTGIGLTGYLVCRSLLTQLAVGRRLIASLSR